MNQAKNTDDPEESDQISPVVQLQPSVHGNKFYQQSLYAAALSDSLGIVGLVADVDEMRAGIHTPGYAVGRRVFPAA